MRGAGIRGTSIAARRADLERLIDIAQATHVDRGWGWERITSRGDKCVHVMPMFGHQTVRVPYAAIVRSAVITPHHFEEHHAER